MEELIEQYKKGQISRTDLEQELKVYFDSMQEPDAQFVDHKKEEMWQVIIQHKVPANVETKVVKFKWWKYAAAAVFIIAIASTYLLLHQSETSAPLSQAQRFKNDVESGREGAVLKLSDGREILLDTVKNGSVAPGFTKTGEGLAVQESAVEYATVIVPKARTEKVTLPDGSTVWLNAGSSITFPTRFSGNRREVSMTGEVYYEVSKNEQQHFFVQTKTDRIEVKGTHFNVNAYADVKTTLLEGSVQIGKTIIKPGDQYLAGKITQPDTEEVMAWKNGMFLFNNTPITEIMAQVERWYDVEIKYEGGDISKLVFGGDVERTANVSVLLKKLELTKSVEFTIEGRTITIKPID
jgi:ferric-dicitrate binding protein FerR (iron transport regulator)